MQSREFWDPEHLIAVKVAVKSLGGTGIGGQEAQHCTIAQTDMLTRERDPELLGEINNIFTEDFRLYP